MANIGVTTRPVRVLSVMALLVAAIGAMNPATAAPPHLPPGVVSAPGQAPGAQPVPTAGPVSTASVDWQPCGLDHPGYDCATVPVPLDYDDPAQAMTYVALTRWPAADAQNRIGSVFLNFGGPGASGVEPVINGFGEGFGAALEGRFDVVGFDPRGVGASEPLNCFDTPEGFGNYLASQPLFPYRQDQYRPYFKIHARLGPECHDDHQRIVGHMNTADAARDLDRLRQAVGDGKLTYLGFSYGSYLGNTYANLFPDKVRALAIDGVLDPRLWSSGRQIDSDRTAPQEVLEEFLRLCDAASSECALWTEEGSQQRWDRLLETIREAPIVLGDDTVITYDMLIGDVQVALNNPGGWDGTAELLDALADAALAGDGQAAAEAVRLRAELIERLTRDIGKAAYANDLDARYGNHCADTEYPRAFGDWMAVDEYAQSGSVFGPLFWWFRATGCADWAVNEDRYVGPWTARTANPVLVVGNYFDPATDYDGAVASDRLLGNSRLLSYAGWGHAAYFYSQCAAAHINTYLLTVALPPKGTVCPANPNPFLPQAQTSRPTPPIVPPTPWLARPDQPADQGQTDMP
jgi:pimeloyl-ACP methyl ester carboxylesterase